MRVEIDAWMSLDHANALHVPNLFRRGVCLCEFHLQDLPGRRGERKMGSLGWSRIDAKGALPQRAGTRMRGSGILEETMLAIAERSSCLRGITLNPCWFVRGGLPVVISLFAPSSES